MPKPRVLLIGWDAADWKVIQPLLAAGQLPNLARLMAGGVRGNLATIYPVLSPLLWTSIATGKRAYKHGIHGFSEPLPDGSGVRPITLLARKTKAVWNILNQTGHRSLVVGWWPSHPAEPLNGVMVSNHFHPPVGPPGENPPLPAGTIHPASLAPSLAELRVNPRELSGEFIRLFVPEYERVDQTQDKRLHALGKIIAETMSVHAVATELLATQPWDFAAIYYCGLDHFSHGFMSYHPPRLPAVAESDFEIYQHVIANAYRYHDAMLGELLRHTDEHTRVIVMSDHGFHPDHLRPSYIPAEPAGPAIEHRHFGILCLNGPGLRINEQIFGASLLDVCPTILALFGLPPGQDMDGKVLLTAFLEPPPVEPIPSWDSVPGEAGTHAAETGLDPVSSAEAFKQLVALGYVAPPGPNIQDTVAECGRELKFNLARSYRDGNCCGEAAALAEQLWQLWPMEHRFGLLLLDCLTPLGQVNRRRSVLEELARRMEKYQITAQAELARRAEQNVAAKTADAPPDENAKQRERFEERRWQELAHGRPLLLEWLFVSQALLEQQPTEARRRLEKLTAADLTSNGLSQRVASALAELGDFEAAQNLLEQALASDQENPVVHSQLAALHLNAGRFEQAIGAATESLSLLYFQPGVHALLGQALLGTKQFAAAESALRVAVAQSPRNLTAHESLGKLYRQHLNRPDEAFAHEGRALTLRNELAARRRNEASGALVPETFPPPTDALPSAELNSENGEFPKPFGADVDSSQIITVVSGLPRTGTSLMMQLLVAAGREVLTDAQRAADEDNPRGYFEFAPTLSLARDNTWLPQARGKVIKVVAQLLPFLPRDEHYQVIFMERNLNEVIASQQAMLTRQDRRGAELDDRQLGATYTAQLRHLRHQLAHRPELRLWAVNYAELLAAPATTVAAVARFLGGPFDQATAASAVRPELRRQQHQAPS